MPTGARPVPASGAAPASRGTSPRTRFSSSSGALAVTAGLLKSQASQITLTSAPKRNRDDSGCLMVLPSGVTVCVTPSMARGCPFVSSKLSGVCLRYFLSELLEVILGNADLADHSIHDVVAASHRAALALGEAGSIVTDLVAIPRPLCGSY